MSLQQDCVLVSRSVFVHGRLFACLYLSFCLDLGPTFSALSPTHTYTPRWNTCFYAYISKHQYILCLVPCMPFSTTHSAEYLAERHSVPHDRTQ